MLVEIQPNQDLSFSVSNQIKEGEAPSKYNEKEKKKKKEKTPKRKQKIRTNKKETNSSKRGGIIKILTNQG